MASSEEQYLDYLDGLIAGEPEFRKISEDGVFPPVFIVMYRDIPSSGMTTTFTMGLSSIDFPHWKLARPELVISVESYDIAWGLAVGYIAYQARGHYGFHMGETIDFKAKICWVAK